MLILTHQEQWAHNWRRGNGGFIGDPAAHALKALEEMIELCYAAGASVQDIRQTFLDETNKALDRGEGSGHPNLQKIGEEAADVTLCMTVIDNEILKGQLSVFIDRKIPILEEREWSPDHHGVLRRPR